MAGAGRKEMCNKHTLDISTGGAIHAKLKARTAELAVLFVEIGALLVRVSPLEGLSKGDL
jgi:hypothetical protein